MASMTYRENNKILWRGVRPAHNGEQVIAETTITNGTSIIYTVPVGKVLYLVEASVQDQANATGGVGVLLRDVADVHIRWLAFIKAQVNLAWNMDHNHFWPPMEIPTGYDICVASQAAGATAIGSIFGWVE